MSRIDQALEKAVKIRNSAAVTGHAPARSSVQSTNVPSVFEVGEGAVNKAAVNKHVVSITDPFTSAAEEYRKLCAKILKATEKDFQNTIMVTSSQPGEGKTITAINFAVAVARELDHTVLLVDADLRKPSIHTYLGLNPAYGLSDYLMSNMNLSDILIKTGLGKLVFLPAGNPPENPAELMSSDRMRGLVQEVKDRYRDRYIIFDSSPLLVSADSLSLCDYVDGTIFVVQALKTDQKTATKALSLIKNYNVLGTVFNNVPKHTGQNRYSYYYRSESVRPENKSFNAAGRSHGDRPEGA